MAVLACNQPKQQATNIATKAITIPTTTLLASDSLLQLINGYYSYKGQLFYGYVQTNFPTGKCQLLQSIYNGKSEGYTKEFFESGHPLSTRYYTAGEKDSVHIGWWDNGNIRFVYHFKNGNYHGSFEEFYTNGKPLKKILYNNGIDSCGWGWRENGKPFMNYVLKDGRRFGLMNAQLCYSLKNENGIFQ
jgi:hypothetical protein